jgi:DNA-binding CsgD family transcriptional regulator
MPLRKGASTAADAIRKAQDLQKRSRRLGEGLAATITESKRLKEETRRSRVRGYSARAVGARSVALDRISRCEDAAFALDGSNRIIFWNKASETLLGLTARSALGRKCYEVLRGRDASGNLYCNTNCPVAFQAREKRDDPVHWFPLTVNGRNGLPTRISTILSAVPSYHPALTILVHVVRPEEEPATVGSSEPLPLKKLPLRKNDAGDAIVLSRRQKEILKFLVDGLSTRAIANALAIRPTTARNHIQNIINKLAIHSKLEAVALAHKYRLI